METVFAELTDCPLNCESLRRWVSSRPGCGAVATFEGITRMEADPVHGHLQRLEYDAYPDMARRQLRNIAEEARRRWSLHAVAIAHRTGSVPVGDASVMIAVASAHRAEAFEACRWLIDTLKTSVPIWKKDVFADGFNRWVEPREQDLRSQPGSPVIEQESPLNARPARESKP